MGELAAKWQRVSSTGQDKASQELDEDNWIKAHGYDLVVNAEEGESYASANMAHDMSRVHSRAVSRPIQWPREDVRAGP